jgi:hypothetical protein
MAESRIVITFDKDFGQLALGSGLSETVGIILFRLPLQSPGFVAHLAVKALKARTDWSGHFSVVEVDRIRMAPLPRKPQYSGSLNFCRNGACFSVFVFSIDEPAEA